MAVRSKMRVQATHADLPGGDRAPRLTRTHASKHAHACTHAHMHACTCTHTHLCMCAHTCVYARTHSCMCAGSPTSDRPTSSDAHSTQDTSRLALDEQVHTCVRVRACVHGCVLDIDTRTPLTMRSRCQRQMHTRAAYTHAGTHAPMHAHTHAHTHMMAGAVGRTSAGRR